jgi:hypothetical protein
MTDRVGLELLRIDAMALKNDFSLRHFERSFFFRSFRNAV